MMWRCLAIIYVVVGVAAVKQSNELSNDLEPNEIRQKNYLRKGKIKPRPWGNHVATPTESLTMTFPYSHFTSSDGLESWKSPGRRDAVSKGRLENEKEKWRKLAWAQYGEDKWLINNWFHGVKDGVILESGGMDGIMFSASHVFEAFLGWTSILVGKKWYYIINNRYIVLNVVL